MKYLTRRRYSGISSYHKKHSRDQAQKSNPVQLRKSHVAPPGRIKSVFHIERDVEDHVARPAASMVDRKPCRCFEKSPVEMIASVSFSTLFPLSQIYRKGEMKKESLVQPFP
ncbi:hypothetical protein J6590_082343 [Homalodisca vitripennis]|nr:hypothetical protein J6590_082343 [Homalodisca vitripennis]